MFFKNHANNKIWMEMIWSGEASFILLSEDEREMEDTCNQIGC